jgi:hypothetical protein
MQKALGGAGQVSVLLVALLLAGCAKPVGDDTMSLELVLPRNKGPCSADGTDAKTLVLDQAPAATHQRQGPPGEGTGRDLALGWRPVPGGSGTGLATGLATGREQARR